MKKVVALLLTICMLAAALVGCGAKDSTAETEKPSQTEDSQVEAPTKAPVATEGKQEQANKEVAVGTILDAPEVSLDEDAEQLYIYYSYPGEKENEVLSMEIAFDQVNEDMYVIYMSDGLLKLHEVIYEVTDSGVTKYYKDTFMENFALDTELTQTELVEEKETMLALLNLFLLEHPDWEGVKYRKSDAPAFVLTGEVYVYDAIEDGKVIGQICVDKATGLLVRLKDTEGKEMYSVQSIKTSNLGIPAYK